MSSFLIAYGERMLQSLKVGMYNAHEFVLVLNFIDSKHKVQRAQYTYNVKI
jgi:hypothetical protein